MAMQITFKSMFRWIVPVIAILVLATVLILATPMFGFGAAQPRPAQQHSAAPAPESSPMAGGGCHSGC